MPWSGGVYTRTNGVFNGASVWAQDRDAGTKITAAHHDTHDQDLAQGINSCAALDGSNTVTILNLSGTVNATSGIVKVGTLVLASTFGTNNAFLAGAGNFTTSGAGGNVGAGYQAMLQLTTGGANVAFGVLALPALTTGSDNVAHGGNALANCTTGSSNTGLGFNAIGSVTTGSSNVGIGANVDVPSASANGQLSLQNALYGTGNTGTSSTVSTGNLGVYVKAPTARMHFPAGTAAAGTAPVKMTAGTNLGTPENGALEFDGNALYITIGGVRKTVTVT